jgi:aminopeptidase YwaD
MSLPISRADPGRLRQHIQALTIVRNQVLNPIAIRNVTRYITRAFKNAGLGVRTESFYSWMTGWQRQENLIATIHARERSDQARDHERVIIGAHYDTVPFSPGADDNASGVATLLEIAHLCAEANLSLRRPVDFIAFGMEEEGCIGSCRHVTRLKRSGTKVAAMVSLECVGYTDERAGSQRIPPGLPINVPDRGTFLGIIGNSPAKHLVSLMQASAKSHAPGLEAIGLVAEDNGHRLPVTRLSDHAPFWDRGYPALMLTDTAFLRNPHYHKPNDTADTLDITFMTKVAQTVAGFTLNAAS